ncbi:MAG: C39 family peptidase [Clostridia bacterium]|nr:C39 family peptidase [Clostridia bacterium]
MKIKKIAYIVTTVVLIAGLLTVPCSAATGFTITPLRGQQTDYWCWCAGNQMLLETQGRVFTQQQIAGGINRGATLAEQHARLRVCASDIQWDIFYSACSFQQVKTTINLGWAIACQCQTSSDGHIMVITGYDQNSSGYNNVWLQDPWGNDTSPHTGVEGWCNYNALRNGNYSRTIFSQWQNFVWNGTIV